MKKSSAVATEISIHLAPLILIVAAAIVPHGVQSEPSWAVGDQYYFPPFINRFEEWGVGYPRRVAYATNFNIKFDGLGRICSGNWQESTLGGNDPHCVYSFNCIQSEENITLNQYTVGYYIGGLLCNGFLIAQCKVVDHGGTVNLQLCDSDTEGPYIGNVCEPYLKCSASGN